MKALIVAVAALALGACSPDQVDLLKATTSPTAQMVAGLAVVKQACPSLNGNAERYDIGVVNEAPASLDAQREFKATTTVHYTVVITDPEPDHPYDAGDHCDYEVSVAPPGGLIAAKPSCIRLCDAKAKGDDGYYVSKL